jgi:dihydrofolate synthase/folylpolyglutamate synthase
VGSSDATKLHRYHAAIARLEKLIEETRIPVEKSPLAVRERAERRLARLHRLLDALGNPHLGYPIVHVAGTSGKGSTSTAVAAILSAAGYRTGLHTSPYLQVATEKLQVDGRLVDPEMFAALVDEVVDRLNGVLAPGEESLTYAEAWVVLISLHFARERVDAAVIEVGAGGRFDMTNVVQPAVSVVTSIGLDHVITLGGTIPEIAWHKAGIIKPGVPAVTAVPDPEALDVITAEAAKVGAPLTRVVEGETYEVLGIDLGGTHWRELPDGQELTTPLPGRVQAANAATAVAAVRALAGSGLPVGDEPIHSGLSRARIPGRFEIAQVRPRVILDGAHNAQKMAALAGDLPVVLAGAPDAKLIVVLGVLEAKDAAQIARFLTPHVHELIVTSPRVVAKPGLAPPALEATARAAGYAGPIAVVPEPRDAIETAIGRARPLDTVLVTGSLYLVGNIRGRWYPDDEIALQRTPWPALRTAQLG